MNLSPADLERCKWIAARAPARKPGDVCVGVVKIVKAVSRQTGVPVDVILSGERTGAAAYARDLACFVARENHFPVKRIAATLRRGESTIEQAVAREKARRGL